MIAAIATAVVIMTSEPCPGHPSLNRVVVKDRGTISFGCGLRDGENIIYILDTGDDYIVAKVKEGSNER